MATADWNNLHKEKFRKVDVYDMHWDGMDLAKYMVTAAPFGGPVATIRDPKKIHMMGYGDDEMTHPRLRMWSSAGVLLAEVTWRHGTLVGFGWSEQETLACVSSNGAVNMFDVHGELVSTLSLGGGFNDLDGLVAECVFWGGGLVARRASSAELYVLYDLASPKPVRRLAGVELQSPPASMALVEPKFTPEGSVEVLLATAEGSVVVVDEQQAQDQVLQLGPFVRMAVSPDGRRVACFNTRGTLYWLSTDFRQNLSKFDTNSKEPPLGLAWCGNDAVVLYWDKILLMVGQFGDFVKYSYESPLVMRTEVDGLRVLTNETCEFLERVPDSTREIMETGSSAAAANLFFSYEEYEQGDAKADDTLRDIDRETELEGAIEACLDAAAREFDAELQRKLLQAASYGALFCEAWEADAFVDRCRTVRLLNAVRHESVGVPLTFSQFECMDVDVLIDRLVYRHHHLLAMRVCEYLRMEPERVLVHWACAKIRLSDDNDDERLGNQIIAKLSAYEGISYSEIATAADAEGRRALATMLLDCEPRAQEQVPLLISMDELEMALEKAVESNDTDLMYMALLHIKRTRSESELFEIVQAVPLARDLLVAYCRRHDLEMLKTFYYHFRMPAEGADVAVIEAYRSESWAERMQGLDIAQAFYRKDRASAFAAAATQQQIRLLDLQRKREEDLRLEPGSLVDGTLSDLLESYFEHGHLRKAAAAKSEFKVSDRRYWQVHIQTLARRGAWEELAKLAKSKKTPPTGWEAFVFACVDHSAPPRVAAEYVARLEYEQRLEWYCNLGLFKEAVEDAARARDLDNIQVIRARCRQPEVIALIDRILSGG